MIETFPEVEAQYNSLKPTSRAAKNLSIWGLVLASAYKLDREKANTMWQHIIDINITNDIAFAKYFVAQIFNKLTDQLDESDAVEFLLMDESRLPLLFLHGYDGGTNDYCLRVVLTYFLETNEQSRIFDVFQVLSQKQDDNDFTENRYVCERLISVIGRLLHPFEAMEETTDPFPVEPIIELLTQCKEQYEGSLLANTATVEEAVIQEQAIPDEAHAVALLRFLLNSGFYTLFTDFLYLEREVIDHSIVLELLEVYCSEKLSLPMDYQEMDSSGNHEKEIWYGHIFDESEEIRETLLFRTSGRLHDKETEYLDSLAVQGNWRKYVQICSTILNTADDTYASSCRSYLHNSINAAKPAVERTVASGLFTYTISVGGDSPYTQFSKEQRLEFCKALVQICSLAAGSSSLDAEENDLLDDVKEFILEITGTLQMLTDQGFDVSAETKDSDELLCDCCRGLIESRPKYDIEYNYDKQKKLRKCLDLVSKQHESYGVETGYILAQHAVVIEYLFLHDAHSFTTKANMILGCLMHNDIERAMHCFDSLITTTRYPNYSDRNGWQMEFKNTVHNVLRDIVTNKENEWHDDYSQTAEQMAITMAESSMQYFDADSQTPIKEELLKLKPSTSGLDDYISNLLSDVDEYTAEERPRGFGKRCNNVTYAIMNSPAVLSKANRIDVLSTIMHKICDARTHLIGPQFSGWVSSLLNVEPEQIASLYYDVVDVLEVWLKEHPGNAEVLRVANKIGSSKDAEVFRRFRTQVIQNVGFIEGFQNCFERSTETDKPIPMLNNSKASISFLFYDLRYGCLNIHMSCMNKTDESIDLTAVGIYVNEVFVSESEHITYLSAGENEDAELCIYSNALSEHQIKKIENVSFSVSVEKDEKKIAKSPQMRFHYNSLTDMFERL